MSMPHPNFFAFFDLYLDFLKKNIKLRKFLDPSCDCRKQIIDPARSKIVHRWQRSTENCFENTGYGHRSNDEDSKT
jgi:hypothetical protein